MKSFASVLVCLVAYELSCLLPFSKRDLDSVENFTYPDASSPRLKHHDRRWMSWLPARPWPRIRDDKKQNTKMSVIRYCFAEQTSLDSLHKIFNLAAEKWFKVLGNPGKDSAHTLLMEHVSGQSTGKPLLLNLFAGKRTR